MNDFDVPAANLPNFINKNDFFPNLKACVKIYIWLTLYPYYAQIYISDKITLISSIINCPEVNLSIYGIICMLNS